MNESILLIDDDDSLRGVLIDRLRSERYRVEAAGDVTEGKDRLAGSSFDLLIIDVMRPFRSGINLCCDVRQSGMVTPILFLSGRTSLIDKVVALKIGGDDYLSKPFETEEFIARVETLLRRAPAHPGWGAEQVGVLRVDVYRNEVTIDGKAVALTSRELDLLQYLMERDGQSISRQELLHAVWGYKARRSSRTVDMHVLSLRKKIERNPDHPHFIRTVSGTGYRFLGSGRNSSTGPLRIDEDLEEKKAFM